MKSATRALIVLAACLPAASFAHKSWILPSSTVLAPDQWITVDAAVSNDLFFFNHVPMRLEALTITAPDGAKVEPQNGSTGKMRSTFDVHLTQNGTYKLAFNNIGVFASYEENGERKRWRGTPERLSEIPATAKNLEVSESVGRVETFVTAGKTTKKVFEPTNKGIELIPVTHPNDLFAGEEARFKFVLDGKPAAGLEIEVVPGGTRYRNQQGEMKLTTNAQGEFSVTWPEAGTYWLETATQDTNTSIPQAKLRRLTYVATFEVLPQ
jgi:uncharacterized GH25 family protein